MFDSQPEPAPGGKSVIREVKYSLKEMLIEVEDDREASVFGREVVEQTEIEKMFKKKPKGRRVKRQQ